MPVLFGVCHTMERVDGSGPGIAQPRFNLSFSSRAQGRLFMSLGFLPEPLASETAEPSTDRPSLAAISVSNFVSKLQGSDCMQWFKSVPTKVCVRNLIPITTLLKVRLSERFSGHEDSSLVDRLMLNINGLAA